MTFFATKLAAFGKYLANRAAFYNDLYSELAAWLPDGDAVRPNSVRVRHMKEPALLAMVDEDDTEAVVSYTPNNPSDWRAVVLMFSYARMTVRASIGGGYTTPPVITPGPNAVDYQIGLDISGGTSWKPGFRTPFWGMEFGNDFNYLDGDSNWTTDTYSSGGGRPIVQQLVVDSEGINAIRGRGTVDISDVEEHHVLWVFAEEPS